MIQSVSKSPGFSFQRVWAFASFYMPRLRVQILVYFAASLVCAILSLIPANENVQLAIFVAVWSLLPILYYCTPLIFAKGVDTRILERVMPVSAAEKMTFFYMYLIVVIPIVVFLLPLTAVQIYMAIPGLQTESMVTMFEMKENIFGILSLINMASALLVAVICFFFVEYARTNRLLWGIVSIVAVNTIIGFVGGIVGACLAFKAGIADGIAGKPENFDAAMQGVVTDVMDELTSVDPLTVCSLSGLLILIVLTGWL
ncbi:MAG: hypothetical protein K2H18_08445, partial [Muribaculaceae bacterium]|nr:hypothetical protein [Muribaculaceae bacterium]